MGKSERNVVQDGHRGVRLDKWLSDLPSVGSRSKAKQALRSGKVSVDGGPVGLDDAGRGLATGTVVEIEWSRPGTSKQRTAGKERLAEAGVGVVHDDPAIVVANKPTGLLTDAADKDQRRNRDTLRKRIHSWLGAPVWPAHRIDRDTTGLVVFAKDESIRDGLMAQWRARTPERVYLVVVEGSVGPDQGLWADWMAWDKGAREQKPSKRSHPGAFHAEANWRVVERYGRQATLLEVRLVSGRRNQIRLQAKMRGTPLVGETMYRDSPKVVPFGRQALHASRLTFRHPTTHAPVAFDAALPDDLTGLLARLRTPSSPPTAPPPPGRRR